MAEVYGTQRRPKKRWGRRLLITFIVLLILIGAALVAVDRFGASYAERVIGDRVAQQVADQKATSAKPDVTIEGVPFLTQVLSGKYQEIKIDLADFSGPAGDGQTIKLPLLAIRAQDVRAPLDTIRSGNGAIVATTATPGSQPWGASATTSESRSSSAYVKDQPSPALAQAATASGCRRTTSRQIRSSGSYVKSSTSRSCGGFSVVIAALHRRQAARCAAPGSNDHRSGAATAASGETAGPVG